MRILSAFDLGGELDKIAMRGARYGLPGWVVEEQRKNGSTRTVYLDRADAERRVPERGAAKTLRERVSRYCAGGALDEERFRRWIRTWAQAELGWWPKGKSGWGGHMTRLIEALDS